MRMTPNQDKTSEVEELLSQCAMPNAIKSFKECDEQMFIMRAC